MRKRKESKRTGPFEYSLVWQKTKQSKDGKRLVLVRKLKEKERQLATEKQDRIRE